MNKLEKLELKRRRAYSEYFRYVRTLDPDVLESARPRYAFPMYHGVFGPYFLWKIAAFPHQAEHPFSSSREYLDNFFAYGDALDLHQVVPYLELLLGEEFERIFSTEPDAEDYAYLLDVIAVTLGELVPVPLAVMRARGWLTEQIRRLKRVNGTLSVPPIVHLLPPTVPVSPWCQLLIGKLALDDFYDYLEACGLLTREGSLTPLGQAGYQVKARKAPWVGALQALVKAGLLDANTAAICRALADPAGKIGVKLSENTLRNGSKKADLFLGVANSVLGQRGLLRN